MNISYSYSKERHLELLINRQKQHQIDTVVFDKIYRNEEEFLDSLETTFGEYSFELETYSLMLVSHLHWENRKQYYQLIEKLLRGPILFLELRTKHKAINSAAQRLEANLILLEPNPKSAGFADFIDELILLFDRYCPDETIREAHEIGEKEFLHIIDNNFKEMKDNYP